MTYHIENFGYAYTPIHMHAQKDILAHMSPVVDFNELHMKSFWRHDGKCVTLAFIYRCLFWTLRLCSMLAVFFFFFFFHWEVVWCLNGLDNGDLSCDSHYRLSLMRTLEVVCWHFQLGTTKGLACHACCSYVPSLSRIMS